MEKPHPESRWTCKRDYKAVTGGVINPTLRDDRSLEISALGRPTEEKPSFNPLNGIVKGKPDLDTWANLGN
jgi:hypothetical protein